MNIQHLEKICFVNYKAILREKLRKILKQHTTVYYVHGLEDQIVLRVIFPDRFDAILIKEHKHSIWGFLFVVVFVLFCF